MSWETGQRHPGGFLPWPLYRRSPDQAMTQETTLHSGEKEATDRVEAGRQGRVCVRVMGGMHGHKKT